MQGNDLDTPTADQSLDQDTNSRACGVHDHIWQSILGHIITVPLEPLNQPHQIIAENLCNLLHLFIGRSGFLPHEVVQALRVRDQVGFVRSLEAEEPGDLRRQEPFSLVADGQRAQEIHLGDATELLARLGRWGVQARRLGGDEAHVEILEIVDRCMLRRRDVNAHGDGVNELVDRPDGWKRWNLAFVLNLLAQ